MFVKPGDAKIIAWNSGQFAQLNQSALHGLVCSVSFTDNRSAQTLQACSDAHGGGLGPQATWTDLDCCFESPVLLLMRETSGTRYTWECGGEKDLASQCFYSRSKNKKVSFAMCLHRRPRISSS